MRNDELDAADLAIELDRVLEVVLVLVADSRELRVFREHLRCTFGLKDHVEFSRERCRGLIAHRVVILAVRVGAVHAEGDGQLPALHAVVPRAEPLLAWHLVPAEARQMVDLKQCAYTIIGR